MTDVFTSAALFQPQGYTVGEGAQAEGVPAMNVTPSFFEVLGVSAVRGRLFTEAEGTPGKNKVAVVSYGFAATQAGGVDSRWQRRHRWPAPASERRELRRRRRPPGDVLVPEPGDPDLVPLAFTPDELAEDARHSQNHDLLVRLAPGVTLASAQARIDAHNAQIIERSGALKDLLISAGYNTKLLPLEADIVRGVRGALEMLWGGVVFVVLIAAVNIANLSFVRASGRMKELATRHALGAVAHRIAKQLITEAIVLTIAGAALGVLLGFLSSSGIEWIGFTDLPRATRFASTAW